MNVQLATSLMTFCHQKAALSHVFQVSVCSKGDQTLFVRYWYCLGFGPWAVFADRSVSCFLPADIVFLNWVWYINQREHAVQSYKPWLPPTLLQLVENFQPWISDVCFTVELMVVPNCLPDQIRAYVVKMWKLGPENYVARSQPRPIQAYTATLLTHVQPKLQLSKSSVFSRVIQA